MDQEITNKIFVLVGPSGAGKNVVLEGILKKFPQIRRIPSYTTRPKRSAEREGREHFFVTLEKFNQLIKEGKLLEYEEVYPGLFYGMALEKTSQSLKKNHLIKDIDIFGRQSLKRTFPKNTVSIFIKPPNLAALEERLLRRGSMTKEEIADRLKRVALEMKKSYHSDYCVINDKLEGCINEVARIISSEIS